VKEKEGVYRDNWLENLLVSASMGGAFKLSPQNPLVSGKVICAIFYDFDHKGAGHENRSL
jgi:hypothetical protein